MAVVTQFDTISSLLVSLFLHLSLDSFFAHLDEIKCSSSLYSVTPANDTRQT